MTDKPDSDLPKSDKKSGTGTTPGTPEKDPKNLPETVGVGEDPNEKKNTPPPDKQPKGPGKIDNASQDPDDPINKTPAKDRDRMRPGAERDRIDGDVYASENLMTEQEKDADGESMGVGPAALAEDSTGPVETIQQQGIGPRTPYPTGDPPPPSESMSRGQGIKGVTDKPATKPGERTGPGTPRQPDPHKPDPHKPEPHKPEPHKPDPHKPEPGDKDRDMTYRTNPPPHRDPTR